MKAMLAALTAIVVIAVGSNLILNEAGFSSQDRGSGPSVRLDD
ncbi:hypothetical protein Z945_3689 [Sulfitobacter noctilucae]|nr:hypothetical protein [Sulfitobacter noctilucae]KIN70313.1 hypothetical protein Z945_3689 [Sulfitobacter noctilucae]